MLRAVTKDCECLVQPGSTVVQCDDPPGTCQGVHATCLDGICQAPNVTGGQGCGVFKEIDTGPPAVSIGTDMNKLDMKHVEEIVLIMAMWASDLYSMQFVCGA